MDRPARRRIFVALALGVALGAAWGGVLAPAAVWLHEGGHAAAALATGGRVLSWTAGPDGAGATRTEGGNETFILVSGYLTGVVLAAGLAGAAGALHARFPRSATVARAAALALVAVTVVDVVEDVFVNPGAASDATFLAAAIGVPAWMWGAGWLAAGAAVVAAIGRANAPTAG